MSDMDGLAESMMRLAQQLPESVVQARISIAKTDIPQALDDLKMVAEVVESIRQSLLLFRPQNAQGQ